MGIFRRSSAETKKTRPAIKPSITAYNVEKKILMNEAYIKSCRIGNLNDFEAVRQDLEYGHVIVIDMDEILSNQHVDVIELKRAVERLRGFCIERGGNIGRIGENYLIITPNDNFIING